MSTEESTSTRPRGGQAATHGHPSTRRRRRRRVIALVVLLLLVVGVVLAILARPLLSAKREADAAQRDLTAAKDALANQQVDRARRYVAQARTQVDAAQKDANAAGADVWSFVPVAGGAVDDARHLVDALDETTSVAEIGVGIYPMVSGDSATLVHGQRISLPVLHQVVDRTTRIGPHLDRAMSDLDQVHGSTPFVGGSVSHAKDTALGYLQPLQETYAHTAPVLQSLPSLVGADGPRTYLLAMLNPAELRYSGGATLSFTTLHFDHGVASFGATENSDDLYGHGDYQRWTPVRGNVFHRHPHARVTNATFSPWWSVSGEELLRGYSKFAPQQHLSGVIGIDLQGLARIFKIAGPVQVPPYGTFTGDNLVQTLAGSYDKFASTAQRHQLNAALVPAFRQRFFEGGHMSEKVGSLVRSAKARDFFTYFRDGSVQRSFAALGLSGDLSPTTHDYIGVFTQNLNGSKADYWQHKQITSHVRLRDDGSAAVHLRVKVTNAAPPYAGVGTDPRRGYFTRYLGALLGIFLPNRAGLGNVTVDGLAQGVALRHPSVADVHNRPYFHTTMMIDAGQSSTVDAAYTVPQAAEVTSDGAMTYQLDIDPQPTVVPENLAVDVTWPAGWSPSGPLPAGWKATANGASYHGPVTEQLSFAFPLTKS